MFIGENDHRISVFCTNIKRKEDVEILGPFLDVLDGCKSWSVDYKDCDHVLCLVTTGIPDARIRTLVHRAGFSCEWLPCDPIEWKP